MNFLKFGHLPFLMYPDDGGQGSGGGGDGGGSGQGDQGQGGQGSGDGGQGQGSGQGQGQGNDGGQGSGGGDGGQGQGQGQGSGQGDQGQGQGKGADDKGQGKDDKGMWGANWRESYAGEDPAKLNLLKRFASPKDALDALFAAQQKIRSGEIKQPLPKDAKPEQVAAWRKENGIPEKAEGYLEGLPEGLVLGDEDKKGAEAFLKSAHDMNLPPDVVNMALKAYVDRQEAFTLQQQEKDNGQRETCINDLRNEYGPEYSTNVNAMHNFVKAAFPEDIQENLLGARLGDGTALFNSPDFIKAFVKIARDMNPTGIPTPGTGFDKLDSVETRIGELEKKMRENRSEWFKDTKSQEELRRLYDARERFKSNDKK